MTKKLYSTELIEQMSRGNKDFVKQVLEVFTEDGVASLNAIQEGISQSDHEKIKSEAHSLKSSIKLLKIEKILCVILEIEKKAEKQQDINQIKTLFKRLEKTLLLTIEQIKAEIGAQ